MCTPDSVRRRPVVVYFTFKCQKGNTGKIKNTETDRRRDRLRQRWCGGGAEEGRETDEDNTCINIKGTAATVYTYVFLFFPEKGKRKRVSNSEKE